MIGTDTTVFHGRIVLVGDSSVGKTSILNMLVEKSFNPTEQSTVGANYQLFINEVNGTHVEMQVWDTAGQEKYKSLGPIYYRNAQAALVVYDQSNKETYDNLNNWIQAFISIAGIDTIIAIVANKCDMETCEVEEEEARRWAENNDYIFYKTSAKTGENIDYMFGDLVKRIVKKNGAQQSRIRAPKKHKNQCQC